VVQAASGVQFLEEDARGQAMGIASFSVRPRQHPMQPPVMHW